MAGEFDGGTQQRRGERIGRKKQNVVTAHGAIGFSVHHRRPVAGVEHRPSKPEATYIHHRPNVRS
jgi:hypothetical protein